MYGVNNTEKEKMSAIKSRIELNNKLIANLKEYNTELRHDALSLCTGWDLCTECPFYSVDKTLNTVSCKLLSYTMSA